MDPDIRARALGRCMAGLFILMTAGCGQGRPAWDDASGVIMRPSVHASIPDTIEAAESAIPPRAMQGSGLAGAMGRVHLKGQQAGSHGVRLPLPQMIDGQTPVCYAVNATPETALTECRLHAPADGNAFITLTLDVKGEQEVRIDWSRVVLIAAKSPAGAGASPEPYRAATACVQSEHPQIKELAERLWPATGSARDYAAAIPGVHPGHGAQRAADKPRCVGYPREWSEHDLHGQRQSGLCAHAGETDPVPIHRDLADHSAPPRDASHRRVRGQRRVDPVRSERCLRGHPPEALAEHHHGQDHPSR